MTFYVYTCPDCGLQVRQDHQTVQLVETKVCNCPSQPVETVEEKD